MSNNTLIIILELTMALESTVGLELIIHTVHFSLGLDKSSYWSRY